MTNVAIWHYISIFLKFFSCFDLTEHIRKSSWTVLIKYQKSQFWLSWVGAIFKEFCFSYISITDGAFVSRACDDEENSWVCLRTFRFVRGHRHWHVNVSNRRTDKRTDGRTDRWTDGGAVGRTYSKRTEWRTDEMTYMIDIIGPWLMRGFKTHTHVHMYEYFWNNLKRKKNILHNHTSYRY